MSPLTVDGPGSTEGFPRVSGDEPPMTLTLELDEMFSPRERG